jgi:hypothetical protein
MQAQLTTRTKRHPLHSRQIHPSDHSRSRPNYPSRTKQPTPNFKKQPNRKQPKEREEPSFTNLFDSARELVSKGKPKDERTARVREKKVALGSSNNNKFE